MHDNVIGGFSLTGMLERLAFQETSLHPLKGKLPAIEGVEESQKSKAVLSGIHAEIDGVSVIIFQKQIRTPDRNFTLPGDEKLQIPIWLFNEVLGDYVLETNVARTSVGAALVKSYYEGELSEMLGGITAALELYRTFFADKNPAWEQLIDIYIGDFHSMINGVLGGFANLCQALDRFSSLVLSLEIDRVANGGEKINRP